MNPLTREWVVKAEEDFEAALRLSRCRKISLWNAVCFHAQQCAEKYLKAVLQENKDTIPKIHHLPSLLNLLVIRHPLWDGMREGLTLLSGFAVEFRYPGESATKRDAVKALAICRSVRETVRDHLRI
ncbi:MAG: HEPN domain-containing protein [bacterium]|jgi:HEPN domain-containing protein